MKARDDLRIWIDEAWSISEGEWLRMSVIHDPDDFSPMIDIAGMHLLPTDPPILGDLFTPPPIAAVRADRLSRLWSRKS